MGKLIGVAALLGLLCALLLVTQPPFGTSQNLSNLTRQIAFLGIYAMGAGIVIITGGIDLSVGSMMGLVGLVLVIALKDWGLPVPLGVAAALGTSVLLGWIHGILITKLRLQPFVVTLCALLIYRGATRYLAEDKTKGFGTDYQELKFLVEGSFLGAPVPVWICLALGIIFVGILHYSVFGRHLFAVGGNELAARYSGIPVDRVKIVAYMLAGGLTGVASVLVVLYTNGVQPAIHGQFNELYAIAAAVVGGCSLRGGEGAIVGILLGASILQVLKNGVTLVRIPTYLEFAVIGGVILLGAIADEFIRSGFRRRTD